MEIHKDDLINIKFDDRYYENKFEVKHTDEQKLELWHVIEETPLTTTVEDIKYYTYYSVLLVLTTIYSFLIFDEFSSRALNSWALDAVVLAFSLFAAFTTIKIISKINKMIKRAVNKRARREQYKFHDKVSTIQVDHYDYVRLVRPDATSVEEDDNDIAM